MFMWLNNQGVRSSKGFTFQCMDRFYFHYIEDGKCIRVHVEPGISDSDGGYCIAYLDSLAHWLPPFEREPISAEKQAEIRQNIADALAFMGIQHRFE